MARHTCSILKGYCDELFSSVRKESIDDVEAKFDPDPAASS